MTNEKELVEKIKQAIDTWLETQDEKATAPIFVAIAEAYMMAMTEVNVQYIDTLRAIKKMVEELKTEESELDREEKVKAIKDELNKLT